MTTDSPDDGDSPAVVRAFDTGVEVDMKDNDELYWITWPAENGRAPMQVGWPMNTRDWPQGNQSNGLRMWAYSNRVH